MKNVRSSASGLGVTRGSLVSTIASVTNNCILIYGLIYAKAVNEHSLEWTL